MIDHRSGFSLSFVRDVLVARLTKPLACRDLMASVLLPLETLFLESPPSSTFVTRAVAYSVLRRAPRMCHGPMTPLPCFRS